MGVCSEMARIIVLVDRRYLHFTGKTWLMTNVFFTSVSWRHDMFLDGNKMQRRDIPIFDY